MEALPPSRSPPGPSGLHLSKRAKKRQRDWLLLLHRGARVKAPSLIVGLEARVRRPAKLWHPSIS